MPRMVQQSRTLQNVMLPAKSNGVLLQKVDEGYLFPAKYEGSQDNILLKQ